MSLIATLSNFSTPVSVRQRFGRLEIEAKVDIGSGTPDLFGNVMTALNAATVQVNVTNFAGTSVLVPSMPLGNYMLMSLLNDGAIVSTNAGTVATVRCMVEIANDGAVPLSGNDRIDFVFGGTFPTGTSTIKIYALDFPIDAKRLNWVEKTVVPAAQTMEIGTSNYTFIAFDKSKVDTVEYTYGDGRRVTYESKEIEGIARDGMLFKGSNAGVPITAQSIGLQFIPVSDVYKLKLFTNGAVDIYAFIPKTLA